MSSVGRRITICPIEATNNYRELTRFEVDTATTSLRDVVEQINADPALLHCKTARGSIVGAGTRLLTFEGGTAGDPVDMFSPAIAMVPLASIVPHLSPMAASNGLTEFAEGQELWLVVDGCETDVRGPEKGRCFTMETGQHSDEKGLWFSLPKRWLVGLSMAYRWLNMLRGATQKMPSSPLKHTGGPTPPFRGFRRACRRHPLLGE